MSCCFIDLIDRFHAFSVLFLQLKKLRGHNDSAIDLSNDNPARGHKEVRDVDGSRYGDNPPLKPTGIQKHDL